MKRRSFLTVKLLLSIWFGLSIMTYPVLAEETAVQSEGNSAAVTSQEAVSADKTVSKTDVLQANSCLYQTHVQDVGWQEWKADGNMSGTEGKSYRLEGIRIKTNLENLGISYQTHIQNIGWEAEAGRGWKSDGETSGTEGLSYRLEAIEIKLTGTEAANYDVWYQVHAQNIGWMGWAKNGERAGTAGYSYRLEGIRIIIQKKGSSAPGSTSNAYLEKLVVPIQVTYEDASYDTTYHYKTINFHYERPVFSNDSAAKKQLNATYDGLENGWKAQIPEFTAEAWNYWNRSSSTLKNSFMKYDERSQMEVSCKEVYNNNNLLSIQQNVYSYYVGAAHGYNELTAQTFNAKTGETLTLGDLLSIDESQIKPQLTNEFAKLNRKYVDLNHVYEQLGPNAKYYLTNEGVCVYFNQYEVAPYSEGRISITIPYNRTDLLKPIETMIK